MLAGPPRLVQLVSVLLLVALAFWYIRLSTGALTLPSIHLGKTDAGAGAGAASGEKLPAYKTDGIDFGIPIRFRDGVVKPPGRNYSRVLVIPKTGQEDLTWMQNEIPEIPVVVYDVEDIENAENKIPVNKGREAMVYLTYLIDHYDDLPDTIIFMHAHQHTWHNNMLLGLDAAQMLKRLNPARVARLGYMNLRCHHDPGCPDWIHMDRPGGDFDFFRKPEEPYFRRPIWEEIHPGAPVPPSLSGICCAQFAVSRDRIRQVPRARFEHYRNWLIETNMNDLFSGRVLEYIWHYIFTGHEVYCPAQNTCYCDGYGICFGNAARYTAYFDRQDRRNKLNEEYKALLKKQEDALKKDPEAAFAFTAEEKRDMEAMNREIRRLDEVNGKALREATERGKDPLARLEETERWDLLGEELQMYMPGREKGPPR